MARTLPNLPDGTFDLDLLESYIRPHDDPHQPRSSVICVENTHNDLGGKALPLDWLSRVSYHGDTTWLPCYNVSMVTI